MLRILLRFVHVVVVVVVVQIEFFQFVAGGRRRRRTAAAERLAAAEVEAGGADALAAAGGVEPAVARGAHRPARVAAAPDRQARGQVRDRAVGRIAGGVDGDHVTAVTTYLPPLSLHTVCRRKTRKTSIPPPLLILLHSFNGLFSMTTCRVSRYQKGKTSLDLNEVRDGRHWHQLDHMQTICTSLQTDNHPNTSSLNF